MAYHNVHIPVYDYLTNQETKVPTVAETVSGLWVHRAFGGDLQEKSTGWVVSTRKGLALFGSSVYGTRVLKTRREARKAAQYLSKFLPNEVKSGEWGGEEWGQHDPHALEMFETTVVTALRNAREI